MTDNLDKLQVVIRYLESSSDDLPRVVRDGYVAALKAVHNSLASRVTPARLVLALSDSAVDSGVVVMASTVPVDVFMVDHRKDSRRKLSVLSEDPIQNPEAVVEVVSDEAAEYLQTDNELIQLIATTCSKVCPNV